jgi:hypothetical protein
MPDGATQSPPVDDYDDGVQNKRPYVVVSPLVVTTTTTKKLPAPYGSSRAMQLATIVCCKL